MKRFLCIFFALLIAASCALCSCNNTADESKPDSSAASSEESAEERFVPHLENRNYSDKVLRILASGKDRPFGVEQFNAVELNDEPVNDACFDRDAKLKEEYGFDIETEMIDAFDTYLERVRGDLAAGTVDYDVCVTGVMTLATLAAEGSLLDILSIPNSNLKLDGAWWDTAAIEDTTIMNKLYFVTGDIAILDDESTNCVFYNKDIVSEKKLDDPIQLVNDKQWTLDKFYTMCKGAALEGGDNGVMDVTGKDTWGLVCACFDAYSLILGCDCPQVLKNSDDIPQLAMGNVRNADAFLTVHEIMSDKERVAYNERFYAWNDPDVGNVRANFYKGQALFFIDRITSVNGDDMRKAPIHYGILPMPMFNDEQENYATTINPYFFSCVSIVDGCKDTDFVTFALEALAYSSKQMVTPEYYDRTLKNKRFPDNDSPAMLDIIFSNRILDLSVIFNWDDCIQYYNQLTVQAAPVLASYLEGKTGTFNSALEATLEEFKKVRE